MRSKSALYHRSVMQRFSTSLHNHCQRLCSIIQQNQMMQFKNLFGKKTFLIYGKFQLKYNILAASLPMETETPIKSMQHHIYIVKQI